MNSVNTKNTKDRVMKILFTFSLYSILSSILTEANAIKRLHAKGIKKDFPRMKTAIESETATSVVVNLKSCELVKESVAMSKYLWNKLPKKAYYDQFCFKKLA